MLQDDQLERYARHIVLKEIGGEGQKKLLAGHAVVIGAGGIGAPVIQYLAAAGLGRLTLVDDDRVSLSNLQRQILFATADVGLSKVDRSEEAVRRLNPDVAVNRVRERIGATAARSLAEEADVVVDGSDNFETRLAVADAALAARTPLVSASVARFEGQLGVFRGWEPDRPCYRCFVGSEPAAAESSCADHGVLGALAGAMGSLAAIEAIRCIVPFGEDSAGKLLLMDSLRLRFRTLTLPKDPGCLACRA